MRTYLGLLSGLALLSSGAAALGAERGYSYVQADLLIPRWMHSGHSTHGDGWGLDGSVAIGSHLFAFAGLRAVKYPALGSLKFRAASLGLGGRVALDAAWNLVGGASIERLSVKEVYCCSPTIGTSEFGWGVGIGLRNEASDRVQLGAELKYRDMADLKSVASLTAGGRYYMTPTVAVGLDITGERHTDDSAHRDQVIVALVLRYDFGQRR